MPEDDRSILDAAEFLATYREGVLFADGTPTPRRFVSDPATGRLLIPIPPAIADAGEHILQVPEEGDDAMALMVSIEPIDPDAVPACDRYLAYHGPADDARWIACDIDAAKWGGVVLDGPVLQRPNPLAEAEPRLCKQANADQDRLIAALRRHRQLDVPAPVCVGVDDGGMHVRARFGVVRVRFPHITTDERDAARAIDDFLNERAA